MLKMNRLIGVMLVTACALVLAATPALAAETRLLEASFGPDGTAATHFEPPAAVAVDQSTGEVYAADVTAGTVEKFNSAHEPEAFTGLNSRVDLEGRLTGFSFFAFDETETSRPAKRVVSRRPRARRRSRAPSNRSGPK
jgi:hypothetical protein